MKTPTSMGGISVKKNNLLCLVLLISMFAFSGCGGGGSSGDDSSSNEPPSDGSPGGGDIAPSAAVLPFGIDSFTLPVGDDGTVQVDFTYNNQGQLTECAVLAESDLDTNDNPTESEKTVYTLDPNKPASLFYPDMIGSVSSVASLASEVVITESDPFNSLPGALREVKYTRTSKTAAGVSEYQINIAYSYDAMHRLEKVVAIKEEAGYTPQKNTLNYTYYPSGNLANIKSSFQYDSGGNTWVNSGGSERYYVYYVDSNHLETEEFYKIDSSEISRIEYRINYRYVDFDAQGRIKEIEKIRTNYSADGTSSVRPTQTYKYTYSGLNLETHIYEDSSERTTYTFSYDIVSNRLIERSKNIHKLDLSGDSTYTKRYAYDTEARLISITSTSDETSYDDKAIFDYDDKGRLTMWGYEDLSNGDVQEQSSATLEYNATESSALGSIEFWKKNSSDNSLPPSDGIRNSSFSFKAGAPTATLNFAIETSYQEVSGAFKETLVTVPLPALYGIGLSAQAAGIGDN
ncbi:MAG: hypothetical protein RBR06_00010 [Desulfuromonadaceae bacterium]|nr:hypothetical protein [Desulfuromonadaceae bacterium]